jgi:sodium transport system ATP-binding protein
MIVIQELAKKFPVTSPIWSRSSAPIEAVKDISLHAPNGHIVGLLGPNGAGKTTTLRVLAGLMLADAGTAEVDGIAVASQPRLALARLGVLTDAAGLYPRLTARENIVYFGALQGLSAQHAMGRAEHLAELLDMASLLDRRTEGFSQGERMKTALARALVHDPANIVLDEPTNGLDVMATRALRQTLRYLSSPEGGAKCICDSVVVVSRGRTVACGTVSELLVQTGQADFESAFVQLVSSVPQKIQSPTL